VNDNLKWWGISYANSKYDSQWVSPSIKVGLPIDLGSGFVVSPNVQVAYTYHHIDSYSETGSNSNASYNAQDIGVVESKVALDLTQTIDDLKATVTLGYLNRDLVTGDSVRVTMIGDTHDVQSLYETHNAGFVRGGLRWDMSEDLALNLAGTYMQGSRSGTNGGNGNISIQYKF
jgi:outer membrane autotransporter protein